MKVSELTNRRLLSLLRRFTEAPTTDELKAKEKKRLLKIIRRSTG